MKRSREFYVIKEKFTFQDEEYDIIKEYFLDLDKAKDKLKNHYEVEYKDKIEKLGHKFHIQRMIETVEFEDVEE